MSLLKAMGSVASDGLPIEFLFELLQRLRVVTNVQPTLLMLEFVSVRHAGTMLAKAGLLNVKKNTEGKVFWSLSALGRTHIQELESNYGFGIDYKPDQLEDSPKK